MWYVVLLFCSFEVRTEAYDWLLEIYRERQTLLPAVVINNNNELAYASQLNSLTF
jgi:hypothetical protein